jgi:hypothetical protein
MTQRLIASVCLLTLSTVVSTATAQTPGSEPDKSGSEEVVQILQRIQEQCATNPRARLRIETRVLVSRETLNRDRITKYEIAIWDDMFSCLFDDFRPGQSSFPHRKEGFAYDGDDLRTLPGPDPSIPGASILAIQNKYDCGLAELLRKSPASTGDFVEPRLLRCGIQDRSMLVAQVQNRHPTNLDGFIEFATDRERYETATLESAVGGSNLVVIRFRTRSDAQLSANQRYIDLQLTVDRSMNRIHEYRLGSANSFSALQDPATVRVAEAAIHWPEGVNEAGLPESLVFKEWDGPELVHHEETTVEVLEVFSEQPDVEQNFRWTSLRPQRGQHAEVRGVDELLVWDGVAFVPVLQRTVIPAVRSVPTGQPQSVNWWLIGNLVALPLVVWFFAPRILSWWRG